LCPGIRGSKKKTLFDEGSQFLSRAAPAQRSIREKAGEHSGLNMDEKWRDITVGAGGKGVITRGFASSLWRTVVHVSCTVMLPVHSHLKKDKIFEMTIKYV
jgi:hypothetical protein